MLLLFNTSSKLGFASPVTVSLLLCIIYHVI